MSSNPQQQAVELLIRTFLPKLAPYVGIKPDMDHAEAAVTDKGCILRLGEIVDCLADAGLLCSSPDVPQEQEGPLRSGPSALGEDSAVYIRLSNRAVNKTLNGYLDSVNIDVDDYDEPVGVEILGAMSVEIDGIEVSR